MYGHTSIVVVMRSLTSLCGQANINCLLWGILAVALAVRDNQQSSQSLCPVSISGYALSKVPSMMDRRPSSEVRCGEGPFGIVMSPRIILTQCELYSNGSISNSGGAK